jgi:RTX calcium-binding nonapeptide repeat (4 copies)
MANFTLTVGADTVTGTAGDDTVNGTAATLYAGDSLTGGAGTDTLALYGSGTFRVDQLAAFTGFESITLNNFTSGGATLYLGSQSIVVTGYGSGSEQVYLGSGAVTFQGGSGSNTVFSTSASNWNAGNSFDGGSSYGVVYLNWNGSANAVYDLTTNTLSHINYLSGSGANLTVKINSAVAGGVANFSASGTNTKLVTSDAALDLSHSAVSGFTVASSNATGTNFTVHDIGTAFQIAGGSGSDTITAQGFAFSADQRNAIFATASVERIVDASGTYTTTQEPAPPPPTGSSVFTLTTGPDTFVGGSEDNAVNGTAATLNAGDSLTGGAGCWWEAGPSASTSSRPSLDLNASGSITRQPCLRASFSAAKRLRSTRPVMDTFKQSRHRTGTAATSSTAMPRTRGTQRLYIFSIIKGSTRRCR